MIKEKSCGTIIVRGEEPLYLLLQYAANHWDFPKGHVEPNETEEETARRELKEETGISKAQIIPGFKETISYIYKRGNEVYSKEVIFFLMKTEQQEVTLSDEHQGFEWLPYEKAHKRLTFKNAKGILEKAHEFMKKAA